MKLINYLIRYYLIEVIYMCSNCRMADLIKKNVNMTDSHRLFGKYIHPICIWLTECYRQRFIRLIKILVSSLYPEWIP